MNAHQPPQGFLRFFKWICRTELFEELQGDLEEAFEENIHTHGVRKARHIYRLEVLKMLRPSVVGFGHTYSKFNHLIMFNNYLKTSFRSMMKNPLSSFINVIGLSIAIGVCVFTFGFSQWTFNTDQFHEKKNKVYLVTSESSLDGGTQVSGRTPRALANHLNSEASEVKQTCRVDYGHVIVKSNEDVFHERIQFVDPEYLNLLTFPLKWGTSSSLNDPNSIIISENTSEKYFDDENPVGQTILVKFNDKVQKSFQITGVARKFPTSRSFDFRFLMKYENIEQYLPGYDAKDWGSSVSATLVEVENALAIPSLQVQMEDYVALQNQSKNDLKVSAFDFEPLSTLHLNKKIKDSFSRNTGGDDVKAIVFMSIISIFIMALACFNYINIAIVSAAKRLKEIGIRKTIGASRKAVAVQFIAENVFITCFALLIGLVLGTQVFIPWFEGMFQFSMGFNFLDSKLWIFLLGILLFTGFASGVYPAFYISRFEVVGIIKGNLKFGRKNGLTKVLLGLQLVLGCILITCGVMFTQNASYINQRSWGYDPNGVIYTQLHQSNAYDQLYAQLNQNPQIKSITGAKNHVGLSHEEIIVDRPDNPYEVRQMMVGANYFDVLKLELKEGRFFHENHESDKQSIIVNEKLVDHLTLGSTIGNTLKIDSTLYTVVGVVKDFHSYSFQEAVEPTLFRLADSDQFSFLAIDVDPDDKLEIYESLENEWAALFPDVPFQGGYQDFVWGDYFREIEIHGRFWRSVAGLAVLLAALGLYGLVSFNVSGRNKEFSIRKALGARWLDSGLNILKQYIWLFAIALVLGSVLSYQLVDTLFTVSYTYHIPMNYTGLIISGVTLISVLLLVVLVQIRRLALSNTVKGLRTE